LTAFICCWTSVIFFPCRVKTQAETTSLENFHLLLHAHLLGKKLGGFEVFWDAALPEPLWAGHRA
jgi:hypothetical protein